MVLVTQHWDATHLGPLNLEAVRALHRPRNRFRISSNRYTAGAEFTGLGRAGRLYVLAGACAVSVGESACELSAGDFVDLPQGQHTFRTVGDTAVEIVNVWELPKEFWRDAD